jgi:predicted metal-dependent hydrolase
MSQTLTQAQKDALIAETLGDVGTLRDEVAKLHADVKLLPSVIEGTSKAALALIQEGAAAVHTAEGKRVGDLFFAKLAAEAHNAARSAADGSLTSTKGQLAAAEQDVRNAATELRQAAASLRAEASWAKGGQVVKLAALTAGATAAAVMIVMCVALFVVSPASVLSADEKRQLGIGQNLEQGWSQLDPATRQRVQAVMDAAARQREQAATDAVGK